MVSFGQAAASTERMPAPFCAREKDIQQLLEGGKMVELGTEICQDMVVELRSELATVAAAEGLKIASSGTHPFSHWKDQLITVHERYATIVKDMQQIARANLIFGLHVHASIPDRERKRASVGHLAFRATRAQQMTIDAQQRQRGRRNVRREECRKQRLWRLQPEPRPRRASRDLEGAALHP
jgi:hypothetical protein